MDNRNSRFAAAVLDYMDVEPLPARQIFLANCFDGAAQFAAEKLQRRYLAIAETLAKELNKREPDFNSVSDAVCTLIAEITDPSKI